MHDVLSPLQVERLERFEARFPATTFSVVAVDQYSRAATLEVEDLETCTVLTITATGRTREA